MNYWKQILINIGKYILKKNGQLILLLSILLSPVLCFLFLTFQSEAYQNLLFSYQTITNKAKTALFNKQKIDKFVLQHPKSDPSFIIEKFESIQFLKDEKQTLASLYNHPAFAHKREISQRLYAIDQTHNHLAFVEEDISSSKNCIETLEKLKQPVKISSDDLSYLLKNLEDANEGPQFMVVKLHLENVLNHIQLTELELLKREFLTP